MTRNGSGRIGRPRLIGRMSLRQAIPGELLSSERLPSQHWSVLPLGFSPREGVLAQLAPKLEILEAGLRGSPVYLEISGATRRDRTGDLLITNQPLYQLS